MRGVVVVWGGDVAGGGVVGGRCGEGKGGR